jgi:hypothetical protein
VQIPHHGSRNNVNPDILDKILGEKGQEENKTAFGLPVALCRNTLGTK